MRKIWLWSLVAGVVVLSSCGVLPQEETVLSGDISQTGNETELSPAEALSWKEAKLTLAEVQAQTGDTTPIVVITEANSGAIVTQTGDSLIYRNEVYGFQVKLGKETKGVKIYAETPRAIRLYGTYWKGPVPWDSIMDKMGYEIVVGVFVSTHKEYWEGYNNSETDIGGKTGFLIDTLWFNNKYFFQKMRTNVPPTIVNHLLLNLQCTPIVVQWLEEKECWDWSNRIFFDNLLILEL